MAKPLTSSLGITSSAETVWNLLTAADGIADWYDDWESVVDYQGPQGFLHVGSTFRLLRRGTSAWCRVTVADPPHRLRWLEIADDGDAVAVEFRLERDGTDGTVVTHTKTLIARDAH